MSIESIKEAYSTEQLLVNGVNEVWIKRDDLIHPIISGNKWRKLKYVLDYCQKKGINHIVTYGGAYSNHALACACATALFKLDCTIIVRGEPAEKPNHYTLMLNAFGAKVVYVSREEYKHKESVLKDLEYNNQETLVLAEGGAHELAYKGCSEIIAGLKQTYDAIFIASGTGTTSIGILEEIKRLKLKTHLYIVPALKNEQEMEEKVSNFGQVTIIKEGHLGGYAKTTKAVFETINSFLINHGIVLDPVYTAKCYIAMQKEIVDWKGKRILFIHTGGQMGLFSEPMLKAWQKELIG